jgi:hypothetical protein
MKTDRTTCPRCDEPKHRGRCKRKAPAAPEQTTLRAELEIPAGLGFRASIKDDTLQLEQDRPDGEDTYTHCLTLTRVEVARFIDWVSKLVEQEPEAA